MRSIPASPSPNSDQPAPSLAAGPLRIRLDCDEPTLRTLIESTLDLYDVPWRMAALHDASIEVRVGEPVPPAEGRYLVCAQMLVDPAPDGLRAVTLHGAELCGRFGEEAESWAMKVPTTVMEREAWVEIEDMLSLIVTTGWRRSGWIPIHGAGLISPPTEFPHRTVVACAAGMGGKTTFTLALVRRGWRALGDDKLLLGEDGGKIVLAAVKHMLNVDPEVSRWFPEAAFVAAQPAYSSWTDKRRVALSRLWPAAPAYVSEPTHLVVLERVAGHGGASVTPLTRADTIAALLRQTVIPNDPSVARPITARVAGLAQRLSAYRLVLHDDAYEDPAVLDGALEEIA